MSSTKSSMIMAVAIATVGVGALNVSMIKTAVRVGSGPEEPEEPAVGALNVSTIKTAETEQRAETDEFCKNIAKMNYQLVEKQKRINCINGLISKLTKSGKKFEVEIKRLKEKSDRLEQELKALFRARFEY